MKSKIFKTIGLIFVVILIVIVFDLISYSTSQEFANIASDQVNSNTDAYKALKVQTNVNLVIYYSRILVIGLSLWWIISIWLKKPKVIPVGKQER